MLTSEAHHTCELSEPSDSSLSCLAVLEPTDCLGRSLQGNQVSTGEYVHRDLERDSFDNFYAFTHHALCFWVVCACVCGFLSPSMLLSIYEFVNTTFHEPVGVISPIYNFVHSAATMN